jgi:C_GCAxxG_C_C family probable redox protein
MKPSKQTTIDQQIAERAGDLLRAGYHCSEAVVLAVGPCVVRDWHPAYVRAATGFAGGVGCTNQELCGALAGGVIVIGAIFGRATLQDDAAAQRLSKQFRARFLETFDMTQCQRLRQEVVKPEGGLGSCAVLVSHVTLLLLQMLRDEGVQVEAPSVES